MSDNNFRSGGNVREVQIANDAQVAERVYSDAFAERYHTHPILEDADRVHLRWTVKTFGSKRSNDLLRHYLKMDNKWYGENAHSISVFRKNLHQINASLGLNQQAHGPRNLQVMPQHDVLAWYVRKSDMVRARYGFTENEYGQILEPKSGRVMSDADLSQWFRDNVTERPLTPEERANIRRIMANAEKKSGTHSIGSVINTLFNPKKDE